MMNSTAFDTSSVAGRAMAATIRDGGLPRATARQQAIYLGVLFVAFLVAASFALDRVAHL